MKVLFFTKYDRLAANTRYRCLQYIPFLQAQGIQCDVAPLLDDEYLTYKFKTGGFKFWGVLRAYFRRLKQLLSIRQYDTLILHYELFPYLPAFFEAVLDFLKINYIYDFDDATFHQYDVNRNPVVRFFFKNKIRRVIKHSRAVIAGNKYLASYASSETNQIHVIPTVVDIERYSQVKRPEYPDPTIPFTIGWIGSPSTYWYVKAIKPALRRFCLKYNARLILVGSGSVELEGIPVEVREWSEESELEELRGFDVGIMPLTDDPWSRGKCGFKLIQYMASSLPVIASPVGVNSELVEHGKSGFLAMTDDEWFDALEKLYFDKGLRTKMGAEGFQRVTESYSLQAFAPRLADTLKKTIQKHASPRFFENVEPAVALNFGDEWSHFPQNRLSSAELKSIFNEYFDIFPWEKLPIDGGVGADIGCGSGRWAMLVAARVRKLICLDASHKALDVARSNLSGMSNVEYVHASVGALPMPDESLDFAYSIGVLHHVPDTLAGIRTIAKKLKPGAPLLIYIYYAFDNRGSIYKFLWRMSDYGRVLISRFPFKLKYWISQFLAVAVYWPLARTAKLIARLGFKPDSWTLSYYRDKAFYVMRTDALDRFGTRLEHRFTRAEIQTMLKEAGFSQIRFSNHAPYWVAVGIRN